jgi:hypothetical protein
MIGTQLQRAPLLNCGRRYADFPAAAAILRGAR